MFNECRGVLHCPSPLHLHVARTPLPLIEHHKAGSPANHRSALAVPVRVAAFRVAVPPGLAVRAGALHHKRIVGVQPVGREGRVIYRAPLGPAVGLQNLDQNRQKINRRSTNEDQNQSKTNRNRTLPMPEQPCVRPERPFW